VNLERTAIPGVVVVEVELLQDERGFFARTFDRDQFRAAGLEPTVAQASIAHNRLAGTVRGMHLSAAPSREAKLVRCTRGAVLDVVVDLREGSATYLQSVSVELSGENRRALYVPPLVAHGYQTLLDDTELTYQISESYAPGRERGVRFDDPALGLTWPLAVSSISEKDTQWPLLAADAASSRPA
jgi:dTDP-4-dehydrorhamnose 3,5-epimerase